MSISQRLIRGENFHGRTSSYSTHPSRNGRVDVPPPHAKELEVVCQDLADIRACLAESVATINVTLQSKPANRAALIAAKKNIDAQLQALAQLQKAKRGSSNHGAAFLLAANVMLTSQAKDTIDSAVAVELDAALQASPVVRALAEKVAFLDKHAKDLLAAATSGNPVDIVPADRMARLRKEAQAARKHLSIASIEVESYLFEQHAKQLLTDFAYNAIWQASITERKEKLASVQRVSHVSKKQVAAALRGDVV